MTLRRALRHTGIALLLIAFAAVLGGGVVYWQTVLPNRAFKDLSIRATYGAKVSDADVREAAHDAIRWVGNHDAFVALATVADESSIPILIRALGRVGKPDEDGVVECVSSHCREALVNITGEDFGYDEIAWERWWKSRKVDEGKGS